MIDRGAAITLPLLIAAVGLMVAALLLRDLTLAGWALACAIVGNVITWLPMGDDNDEDDTEPWEDR